MAVGIGDLVANLTMNTAGFVAGAKTGENALGRLSQSVTTQVGSITNTLGRIGLAFNGVQGIRSAIEGTFGAPIRLAAEFEQTGVAFEVMLGSAERATSMLAEMRRLASSTPLEMTDITNAGRTLLQFGVDADKILNTLQVLSDVTGGSSERFKQMALAFGQMSAAGRLMGQDLLQMINAGFNPLQTMSEQTGKSIGELKKQMEAGQISTQMVEDAFRAATEEGGRFHGMMQKQSQTTEGQMAKLRDAVSFLGIELGQKMLPAVNKLVSGMSVLVSILGKVPGVIITVTIAATSLVASLKAVAIAQATIKALQGPAGWAALAASLTVAAAAGLEISGAFDQVASSAQRAETAVSNLGKASGDWKSQFAAASGELNKIVPLLKDLENLRFIREAQPDFGEARAAPAIQGLRDITSSGAFTETERKVIELNTAIGKIREAVKFGDIDAALGSSLEKTLTNKIGELNGANKALAALQREIDATKFTPSEIALREFGALGVTATQMNEFKKKLEIRDLAKKSQDDFNAAVGNVAKRSSVRSAIQSLEDSARIAGAKSEMERKNIEKDIELRRLQESGATDAELRRADELLSMRNDRPAKSSDTTTGVAVAQSREAVSIIARSANSQQNKLLSESQKQSKIQEQMKTMIGDLPDQFGKSIKLEVASIV